MGVGDVYTEQSPSEDEIQSVKITCKKCYGANGNILWP